MAKTVNVKANGAWDRLNRWLDQLVRPRIRALGGNYSAFKVCGYTGVLAASALTIALVMVQGLSLWVIGGIIVSAIVTFFSLAMITKIIIGQERLIYYHHEIAVISVAAVILWLFGQPVLPYLDAAVLGVGMFLAFGRLGCLMVGCCHGRPWRCGVRYRSEHAAAGFTAHYVGVRLFPIQAVESLTVLGLVTVGSTMVWTGWPPGSALAWYIITYDVARFSFEFLRGDPTRPYVGGFSEAQWTSLLLMVVVVALEAMDYLPSHQWHGAATISLILLMAVVAVRRRCRVVPLHRLRIPRHVQEVAKALDITARPNVTSVSHPSNVDPAYIPVTATSLGICISAGITSGDGQPMHHYTLSNQNGDMSKEVAHTVAQIIIQLKNLSDSNDLTTTGRGVYHLLVPPTHQMTTSS